ncbi:MAG: glycosyltransferase family 4 protein [Candidatus Heimdallarchaeaceae archaeon]
MRIAIVIHGFPPEYMAGSEVYTLHLAKELNKKNEIVVFHRIENPFLREYSIIQEDFEGVKKYMINIPYLPHYFEGRYINKRVEELFISFLEETKPDVIHFGHLNYLSTNLISIVKEKEIPIVFTLHDFWLYCPRGQLISRRDEEVCHEINPNRCLECLEEYFGNEQNGLERIKNRLKHIQKEVVKKVDLFIAPSQFLLNKMVEFGIPKETIRYLDYGFNYQYFEDFKKIPSDKIRFGYIGRIIPTKGVHLIIDAFNKVESEKAELFIYGSSSSILYLKKRAKNPRIFFRGSYENWEISKVLAEIDVLIVPSIWFENSPLVIHEAALAKIPLIATNLGGMAEYVKNRVNGLLFERNNANDLFNKISEFINNPNLIEQLAKNPIKVVSAQDDAALIEEIYIKLLSEK